MHTNTVLCQGRHSPAYLSLSLLAAGDHFATAYTEGNWKNQLAEENNPLCVWMDEQEHPAEMPSDLARVTRF